MEKSGKLHGVKLDRQMVGKKLIVQGSNNPFSSEKRYEIACRYCLEEDIVALFEERKNKLSGQGKSSLLEYSHLVKTLSENLLMVFGHILLVVTSLN